MNILLMIGLAPLSWRFGRIRRKYDQRYRLVKLVFALGPLRVSMHDLGKEG
jgi:hypothetical protein